ncbi:MAG TPA: hypothetical protein VGV87_23005, partial [Blastocatellia bacterium]|nr:hypothetical protein [Blastocatellia bacterium]
MVSGFGFGVSGSWVSPNRQTSNPKTRNAKPETTNQKLMKTDNRIGVLLFNLGGPEKLEDVKPFLFN